MKEVDLNYIFDLERVIKKSNKNYFTKKGEEKKTEANYIIDSFAKEISVEPKKLKKAKIKTTEILITTSKKNSNPKNTRKRVTKDYIMTEKEKLHIIRQITLISKIKGLKEISRSIEIFEEEDLIRLGYLKEEGSLNYEHPVVKKLVPKKSR